ncbi:hypothetical protein [Streptomyces gobiensis]|uniref:hypothetical protein n=1 Tax=Streptomyces gobiensis TaxID=2875706 RepID=UPI001E60390D|nr:hypothetical protein [Streptomyces gobiensis]UGY93642.1 hypothetical protein test1122_19250 [Streptomyces gobiensis]
MTLTEQCITEEQFEELLADDSIAIVHRTLWLLLWEGELRVLDLLSCDVRDVHFEERRVSRASGKAVSEGVDFSERAAALLAELTRGRDSGPLFAVGERALSWEAVVRTAGEHGHAIHAFRAGGKLHRTDSE